MWAIFVPFFMVLSFVVYFMAVTSSIFPSKSNFWLYFPLTCHALYLGPGPTTFGMFHYYVFSSSIIHCLFPNALTGSLDAIKSKIVPLKAEPGPSYWEGSYPPSSVLGIGEKISSKVFGPMSLVALLVGLYCINENNISNQLSATNVNPSTVMGSLLIPISWGMHVAAWIQQKNGR